MCSGHASSIAILAQVFGLECRFAIRWAGLVPSLRVVMANRGLLRELLLPSIVATIAAAVRVPSASTVGADLLARAAHSCDMPTAWRLLNSSSFNAEWLTQMGSAGETPLMAATAGGCSEFVAMLILHPEFDQTTIRKERQRTALRDYARSHRTAEEKFVNWALSVMDNIRLGKVSTQELEWDPMLAVTGNVWFLPKVGEWIPPMSPDEMGLPRDIEPTWDLDGIVYAMDAKRDLLFCLDDSTIRFADFDRLWRLLVVYLQAAEGSELRQSCARHMRSIGWSLFFWHGRKGLLDHSYVVMEVSRTNIEIPSDDSPAHEHLRLHGNSTHVYRRMGETLSRFWDRIGDWLVVDAEE